MATATVWQCCIFVLLASFASTVAPDSVCSGKQTLVAQSGTFGSGSPYDNLAHCSWLIQPERFSTTITVTFNFLLTQQCCDYVEVFNGVDEDGTWVGSFSGTTAPEPLVIAASSIYVVFVTDGSITQNGFSATYSAENTECFGRSVLMQDRGFISEGTDHQRSYSNNKYCEFLITPGTGTLYVVFAFPQFQTELNHDFVSIYAGSTNRTVPIAVLSGSIRPAPVTVHAQTVLVTFSSDAATSYSGFIASYQAVISSYTPITGSPCGGGNVAYITSTNGGFDDGSGLGLYGSNLLCTWRIQPLAAGLNVTSLVIRVQRIEVESCCDTLKLYAGDPVTGTLVASLNGDDVPMSDIIVSASFATVVFETNGYNGGGGFFLRFTSCSYAQCFSFAPMAVAFPVRWLGWIIPVSLVVLVVTILVCVRLWRVCCRGRHRTGDMRSELHGSPGQFAISDEQFPRPLSKKEIESERVQLGTISNPAPIAYPASLLPRYSTGSHRSHHSHRSLSSINSIMPMEPFDAVPLSPSSTPVPHLSPVMLENFASTAAAAGAFGVPYGSPPIVITPFPYEATRLQQVTRLGSGARATGVPVYMRAIQPALLQPE
eukprot:TRINITY_DN7900_c0_g1_i1.p1 TRINITY_DN7900_c0_g1~~TRINITY_DN7900_c0_g1_i1.p1  ORF type:complete len:600 (-),score=58.76 TRINITY_DN7900_c0_g1_i1:143-1942(-)